VHNYGMLTHQNHLFRWLRSKNRFSATSVDQLPHHLTSLWLFGHKSLFPIPDIDRSDYFLMLGANPLASNGSIWTVPDVKKRIKALKQRGGKLLVLRSAAHGNGGTGQRTFAYRAGQRCAVSRRAAEYAVCRGSRRPGTAGRIHNGLDEVAAAVRSFTPELAELTAVSMRAQSGASPASSPPRVRLSATDAWASPRSASVRCASG
jgi:predicted molibdopterin-dependent oxidoreductase YjgC